MEALIHRDAGFYATEAGKVQAVLFYFFSLSVKVNWIFVEFKEKIKVEEHKIGEFCGIPLELNPSPNMLTLSNYSEKCLLLCNYLTTYSETLCI